MTLATLLTLPDHPAGENLFAFDHAMAHRGLMAVMGPLNQWSKMPYHVDPFRRQTPPAGSWHQSHQQAHDDFTRALPAYGAALTQGIPTAKNLIDTDLNDEGRRRWWTFNNHQEHLIANNAILPLPLAPMAPPPAIFNVPWWALPPRLAATYW